MKCSECDGKGSIEHMYGLIVVKCELCGGAGEIPNPPMSDEVVESIIALPQDEPTILILPRYPDETDAQWEEKRRATSRLLGDAVVEGIDRDNQSAGERITSKPKRSPKRKARTKASAKSS